MYSKRNLLFILLSIVLISCSTEIAEQEEVKTQKFQVKGSSTFPLDFEQQDQLFKDFLTVCTYPDFNKYIIGIDTDSITVQKRRHALLNSVIAEEELDSDTEYKENTYKALLEILENNQNDIFSNTIERYCTANYLNFNVYIPHSKSAIDNYKDGDPIYVVNALYQDALGKHIIREYLDNDGEVVPIYSYTSNYVIQNNNIEWTNVDITEDFCLSHLVYFVSFRDEIVNWNHFAKGKQSISDWLIANTIEYKGYGCTTFDELMTNGYSKSGLILPILHSKKSFDRKNCDERYDHFCKFGKPTELSYGGLNMEDFLHDSDPYRTSWLELDFSSNKQYISIIKDGGLDLEGHDFYIQDTTLKTDDGLITIYIPRQVSQYDINKKAQCLFVLFN